MFRDWLAEIVAHKDRGREAQGHALFKRILRQVDAGRKFTREEMNER